MVKLYKIERAFYFNGVATFSSIRGLRPLIVTELVSSFSMTVQGTAIPWIVLSTGGSASQLGLVVTVELLALLALGLPLSTIADRIGARRWILAASIGNALVAITTAMLASTGNLPIGVLVALVAIVGALRGPTTGSQQDLLAHFVAHDPGLLSRATSVLQGANRTAIMVGPPVAGALVAGVSPPATLYATAAASLIVALMIRFLVPPVRVNASEEHPRLLDGVRELGRDKLVKRWSIATFFSEAAYQALFVAIPLLTLERYSSSAALAGLLVGAFGTGAVSGSAIAAMLTRVDPVRLTLTGKIAQGILFAILVAPLPPVATGGVLALLGIANGLTNGPASAVQIPRLSENHRNSALTAAFTFTMGGGAAGSALAGTTVDSVGFTPMFVGAAVLLAVSCILYLAGARRKGDAPTTMVDSAEG